MDLTRPGSVSGRVGFSIMSKRPDPTHAKRSKLVGDARGGPLSNVNRDERARAERDDPEKAAHVTGLCEQLDAADAAVAGKGKKRGGRPKGSRSRPPEIIARERILRTINGLGERWLKQLATDSPYLFTQLVKRVLPGSSPVKSSVGTGALDRQETTLRLKFDAELTPASTSSAGPRPDATPEAASRPVDLSAMSPTDLARTLAQTPEGRELLGGDKLIAEARAIAKKAIAKRIVRREQAEQDDRDRRWRDRVNDPAAWHGTSRFMPFGFGPGDPYDD